MNQDQFEKIKDNFSDCLSDLLLNPLLFFSEGDVQAYCYAKILKQFSKKIETGVSIGTNQKKERSDSCYKTLLIHREYGYNSCPDSRSDLAIFSEEDCKLITQPLNLKTNNDSYIEPDILFEFGTEKSAGSESQFEDHIKNDLWKITTTSVKTAGYIIHIQRVYNKENDLEKYDDFVSHLKEIKENEPENSKIKVIFALVSIGCDKPIFKDGKIKLFVNDKLQAVDQKKIKTEIRKLL